MMCLFFKCRWFFIANAERNGPRGLEQCGLYQCTRCKTLSIGSPR
jgi:hypothetical protein